jgi:hypothetical protein
MRTLLLLTITSCLNAQAVYFDTVSTSGKLLFLKYLHQKGQIADARFFAEYINRSAHSDTLSLYETKLLLQLRIERKADTLLSSLNILENGLENRKTLMKNHIALISGNFSAMKPPPNSPHVRLSEMWRIQLLAAAVLKNNPEEFDLVFESGRCSDPILSLIEYDLYILNMERLRTRRKSPALAGLLSAVIPGLGKIYAGKPHESLHTFMPVAFNAVQAGEGFYHLQWKSPHFYFFGAATALFYTSNVVGSVRASKRKNSEFEDKIRLNTENEIIRLAKYY